MRKMSSLFRRVAWLSCAQGDANRSHNLQATHDFLMSLSGQLPLLGLILRASYSASASFFASEYNFAIAFRHSFSGRIVIPA